MFPFLIPILLMLSVLIAGNSPTAPAGTVSFPNPTATPNRLMILSQDNRDTVRLFYTHLGAGNYDQWEAMLDPSIGWNQAKSKQLQKNMTGVDSLLIASVEPFRKQDWTLTRRNYQASLDIGSGRKTISIPSPFPALPHGIVTYIITLHMNKGEWRIERVVPAP